MKSYLYWILLAIFLCRASGSDLGVAYVCPSMDNCGDECRFGRKLDKNGCPKCFECITETIVEEDIVIDSRSYGDYVRKYGDSDCEEKKQRGLIRDERLKWPSRNGEVVIPYTFKTSTFDGRRQKIIKDVMKYFESKTCIKFYRRTYEQSYIEFYGIGGCSSYVGRIGNAQRVTLGRGCERRRGTIIHEIMHALGFWHEHSRPDRDRYININFANIKPGTEANFQKQTNTIYRDSPYDINSVMHYGGYSFSNNRRPTIRRRDNGQPVEAQRKDFSKEDLKEINNRYCPHLTGKPATARPATRPPARPTARPTARPNTAKPTTSKCTDNNRNCNFWRSEGYCTGQFRTFMKTNCPAICGFCKPSGTAEPCEDKRRDICPTLLKNGACSRQDNTWKTYVAKNCRKTCKICRSTAVITPAPTTIPRKTTTTATTTTKPTPKPRPANCKDENSNCRFWKSQGHCQRRSTHYRFMTQACSQTCGFCKSIRPVQPTTNRPSTSSYVPCGTVTVKRETHRALLQRIVGGRSAIHGSIPWIVSIRRGLNREFCAGALINGNYLVTAAHCFYKGDTFNPDVSGLIGFVGKHRRAAYPADKGQKTVTFSRVTKHPRYDHATSDNDIAILKLSQTISFSDFVRPICLPGQGRELANHTEAFVSGWGSNNGRGYYPDELQQAEVRTIKNNVCNRWLRSRLDRGYDEVTANMFCAGYQRGGRDACQGDSGGPLTIEEGGRHYLVGVVSWGYGCAERSRPGIYTKVSSKVNWIYQNLN